MLPRGGGGYGTWWALCGGGSVDGQLVTFAGGGRQRNGHSDGESPE